MSFSRDLAFWLEEVSSSGGYLLLKRLSGNDTLANGSHQAGPYVPRELFFELFPVWQNRIDQNQKGIIQFCLESHNQAKDVTATWYNNKYRGGTRDETRITGFGGQSSALLDPENTGALAIFCFLKVFETDTIRCRAWLTRTALEEDQIEALIGPVEPGQIVRLDNFGVARAGTEVSRSNTRNSSCWLKKDEIPESWLAKFPSGLQILEHVLTKMPASGIEADARLIQRRKCEEDTFYSVEEAVELESITKGFDSVESFITKAKSMTQRRLSRSGRSFELHARQIFEEEGLHAGTGYSWQPTTEHGKKPDFLFPSVHSYQDLSFPAERLRMLAVKTTCKDRWRQVINEADRVKEKHLLTLQEGISANQFDEMKSEGVRLVVPRPNFRKFSSQIRKQLISLSEFISEVREL